MQSPRRVVKYTLVLFFCELILACCAVSEPRFPDASSETLLGKTAPQAVDPNKGPSELNHHIAGWALISVGLFGLASTLSPRRSGYRYLWPALFVLAGLYLALWSDGEIWPRGNLSWLWLVQHDAEARQHKIYSLLLITIGIVEYLRIRNYLPRLWRTWAFPLLALIGASMLLVHDHSGGSGARSPEAQPFLVNPALDVNGSPRKSSPITIPGDSAEAQHQTMHHSSGRGMDDSTMHSGSMVMDHSQMKMDTTETSDVPHTHHHVMTASMLRVEREHMWFMIVGLAIGLFKFIADGEFLRTRIIPYLWPSCMALLGMMLVLYRE